MKIKTSDLELLIRRDFSKKYRRFAGFIDSGDIWDEFCVFLRDRELLAHVIFCNDVMLIPPVRTHLMLSRYRCGAASSRDLSVQEKQELGAAYGFLFKEILQYPRQESVSCVINTVKTATRYERDEKEAIELTEGAEER